MTPGYQIRLRVACLCAALSAVGLGAAAVCAQTATVAVPTQAVSTQAVPMQTVPAWLFPMNPRGTAGAETGDEGARVHLARSERTFAAAQLGDLFYTPDWFPRSHGPLPDIVAHGRPPDVYACGYCHLPSGQGRPENSSLAGLSAAYIEQQVADFKSGVRRSPWNGPYPPPDLMIHLAAFVTPQEVASAAAYFSRQRLRPRVQVVERSRVPRPRVQGLVYAAVPGGGDEDLGVRMLEFAPDPVRHESRDESLRYVAYVPVGSIGRGAALARGGRRAGGEGRELACVSCHGAALRGAGDIPGLAGRSPSYLLRQLLGFKVGARAGATGAPMKAVVADLQLGDMIDAAAYAASLPP